MGDIDVSDFTSGLLHALGPTLGPSGRAAATRALQDFAQTTGLQNSNDACDDRVVTLLLNESSIGQAHTDGEAWKEVANLMSLSLCSKDLRNLLLAVRLCLSEALVGATIQSATTKREVWELIDQLHKACCWTCSRCATGNSPYTSRCNHCELPKYKNPRPLRPRSPATSHPSTGLAVASALLQCAQIAATSLSATLHVLQAGASNPPPAPGVRRLIGAARVPFCLNASEAGVQLLRQATCQAAQHAIDAAQGRAAGAAAHWRNCASEPVLVGMMQSLLHLLKLHTMFASHTQAPTQGNEKEPINAASSEWKHASEVLLAFKVHVVAPAPADAPLAGLRYELGEVQTFLEASAGAEHLASCILGIVQQRGDAHQCALLVSIIPTALGFTPAEALPAAVAKLTAALLQMAVFSNNVDNAAVLVDPSQPLCASRIAWTALGAMLHDPRATRTLQPSQAQAAIDAVALAALVGLRTNSPIQQTEALGVASRTMDLLSALNRAPMPCVAEAVALSAIVPELIGAALSHNAEAVMGWPLTIANAAVARAHKGALLLLYNVVFGAFSFHTRSPAEPRVRAVKPMWDEHILQHIGSFADRGAALAFTYPIMKRITDEDPFRRRLLRDTTQAESDEIERSLCMVFSLLRAVQGAFGLSVDTMHPRMAPRQPSQEAAEALVQARFSPAQNIQQAATIDFNKAMRGSVLFVPPVTSRVLTGLCGGDIVASVGEYYIVSPTGDARGTAVYVSTGAPDADQGTPVHPPPPSARFTPGSASARDRHSQAIGQVPVRFDSAEPWRVAHMVRDEEELPQWSHYAPLGHMLVRKDILAVASTTGKAVGDPPGDFRSNGVPYVPCTNPTEPHVWKRGGEDEFRFGCGDGTAPLLAQPAMPTVLRLRHQWGRMPQGNAAAHSPSMVTAVADASKWGEWQELAPALAHPVDWEVAGTLPDASPPVVLFRPVPPDGFAALGVVAVPYSPDAHEGRLVRQPSQVMATDATSRGAAAAKAAAARRGKRDMLSEHAPPQHSSQHPGAVQPQGAYVGGGGAAGQRSDGALRLPPPPALDSVWCVHFSVVEGDDRLLMTGIGTDGGGSISADGEGSTAADWGGSSKAAAAVGPDGNRSAPQLVALSTLGRTFDVRSHVSLSVPASQGRNMGPLYRLQHQPQARPVQQLPQPVWALLDDIMGRAAGNFTTRQGFLQRHHRRLPGSLSMLQGVLSDFASRVQAPAFWYKLAKPEGVGGRVTLDFPPSLLPHSLSLYHAMLSGVLTSAPPASQAAVKSSLKEHAGLFSLAVQILRLQQLDSSLAAAGLALMANLVHVQDKATVKKAENRWVVAHAMLRFPGHATIHYTGSWLLAMLWVQWCKAHNQPMVAGPAGTDLGLQGLYLKTHPQSTDITVVRVRAQQQNDFRRHLMQASRFTAFALGHEARQRTLAAFAQDPSQPERDVVATEALAWYNAQQGTAGQSHCCVLQ